MWRRLLSNHTARLVLVLTLLAILLGFLFARLIVLQLANQRAELDSVSQQEKALLNSAKSELARREAVLLRQARQAVANGEPQAYLSGWMNLTTGEFKSYAQIPEFSFTPAPSGSGLCKRWLALLDDDRTFPSGRSARLTATVELAKNGCALDARQQALWQTNMRRLWLLQGDDTQGTYLPLIRNLPDRLRARFRTQIAVLEKVTEQQPTGLWLTTPELIGLVGYPDRDWAAARDALAELGVHLKDGSYSPDPHLEPVINRRTLLEKHRRERFVLYGATAFLAITMLILVFSVQALLASQRRRQMMIHTVSHEFRTPLASMLQFTEMLLDKRYPNQQRAETYLQLLHHQGQRLKGLIENVMTFAKIEKRHFQLDPTPVDTHKFLRAQQHFWALLDDFFEANLTLHIHHPPFTENLDEEALTRILTNLIDNARKYGNPPIEIHARADSDNWILEVRDHGPGLPQSGRKAFFQPYRRGPIRHREGLGLGLSVVYALVKAMRGEIATISEPCFGIQIRLPLAKEERP